jgi:hypothetical protein
VIATTATVTVAGLDLTLCRVADMDRSTGGMRDVLAPKRISRDQLAALDRARGLAPEGPTITVAAIVSYAARKVVALDAEHLRDCDLCREAGRARPSAILSVAFLAVVLLGLAGATGKLRAAMETLPLPEPSLNGWPLGVLLVAGAGCFWRMRRAVTPAHEFDELAARRLEKWPRGTEREPDVIWTSESGEVGPADDVSWCKGHPGPPEVHRSFVGQPRPGRRVRP